MATSPAEAFLKRILKFKRFRGSYQEKRFAREVQRYKDVIVVKATEEPNLALDFNLFIDAFSSSSKWIGLTSNEKEKGFSIWTDLEDENLPFDDYDFEIRSVRFTETEVFLKLRVLQKSDPNRSSSINLSADGPSFDISNINWSDYEPKKILNVCLGYLLSIQWNWAGIKQSIEFVLITIVYLVSEIPNIIRFVGEFTLRVFRELSNLIHVSTPIFMAIIDMLSKIFGVCFMLISDVIRSGRGRQADPRLTQRQQRQLTYR